MGIGILVARHTQRIKKETTIQWIELTRFQAATYTSLIGVLQSTVFGTLSQAGHAGPMGKQNAMEWASQHY
jgi:hypothetical protein